MKSSKTASSQLVYFGITKASAGRKTKGSGCVFDLLLYCWLVWPTWSFSLSPTAAIKSEQNPATDRLRVGDWYLLHVWTFYGAVGTAANVGWGFLPIYLGPAISFLVFWAVFKKIGTLTDVHGISSIADFIATRYGKARSIAVLITMMALLVVVPYIALQLKAISTAWSTLTGQAGTGTPA